MLSILIIWLANAITLLIVSQLVPGFHIASFGTALILAIILGLLNAIIRPIILLLTLPFNILTLGLFTFIVNALMLTLASAIVKGFSIDSFGTAVFAAILLWLISFISNVITYRLKY
jgi:putative membrane protein